MGYFHREMEKCSLTEICNEEALPNVHFCEKHYKEIFIDSNTSFTSKRLANERLECQESFQPKAPTTNLSELDIARLRYQQQDKYIIQPRCSSQPSGDGVVKEDKVKRCAICSKEVRGCNRFIELCYEHQIKEEFTKRKCHHPQGCSIIPRDVRALFCHKHCNLKKQARKAYDSRRREKKFLRDIDKLEKQITNVDQSHM